MALSSTQKKWTLISTILASSMVFIDSTALNVSLPGIQRDLDIDGPMLLWVVNAYALFFASLLLFGGTLGDIYGRNRIFLLGILIFSCSSISCGLAPTGMFLVISRAVQGIGAALMAPGSLSILSSNFQKEEKGRAIGTWSLFSSVTTIAGPLIGGWLAGMGFWRGIFFLNIPLAIISVYGLLRFVPESHNRDKSRPDYLSSALITGSLTGITLYFIQAPELTWTTPLLLVALGLGLLFLSAFIVRQMKINHPLVPLHLFTNRVFSGANVYTFVVYAALSGMLFFLPLDLIQVQGYPEGIAGLAILPFGLLIALLARVAGRWVDRRGFFWPLFLGPILTGTGFFLLSIPGLTEGPAAYFSTFFPGLLLAGTGMGITVVPITTAAMSALPDKYSGIASGINNTMARTAGVLAIAVFGAIALSTFRENFQDKVERKFDSQQQIEQLMANSIHYAETEPPNSFSTPEKQWTKEQVNRSFIASFRYICYLAMALCVSGIYFAFLLRKEVSKS